MSLIVSLFSARTDLLCTLVLAQDIELQRKIKDRRNSVGKPVFRLAPFGSAQLFTLVAPDLCVPGVPCEVLQQVISQASTADV